MKSTSTVEVFNNAHIESEKFQYQLTPVDTRQKNFKIKGGIASKKKKKVRYPTQILMIGQIKCLFFKYFKHGRRPFLSIGPSWPFTIGLLVFAFGAFFYFMWMLTLLKILDVRVKTVVLSLMTVNIGILLTGILKNPGIPQAVIDRILKSQIKHSIGT